MLRLILGIIAGFLTGAILSTATDHIFHVTEVFPPYGEPMFDTGLLLLATSYRIIFQIAGAYVAGVVAKEKAMTAALSIGIVGTVLWLLGTFAMRDQGPLWYGLLGAALSIPTTWLGGKLYLSRSKPQ